MHGGRLRAIWCRTRLVRAALSAMSLSCNHNRSKLPAVVGVCVLTRVKFGERGHNPVTTLLDRTARRHSAVCPLAPGLSHQVFSQSVLHGEGSSPPQEQRTMYEPEAQGPLRLSLIASLT